MKLIDQDDKPISIVIRNAKEVDLERIIRLAHEGSVASMTQSDYPDRMDDGYLNAFRRIQNDSKNSLMVAEIDGVVVGTFQLTYLTYIAGRGREDCQIEAVYVDKSHRGRGIGTKMIEWAIDQAKIRCCRRVQLTTNKRRVDAHRFYQRLGFVLSHEGAKLELEESQ